MRGLTLGLLFVFACGEMPCGKTGLGYRYVLMGGVRGCATVDYDVPGAPELANEDGFALVVVDHDGQHIATASTLRTGQNRWHQVYDQTDGGRVRVELALSGYAQGPRDGGGFSAYTCFRDYSR